MKIHVGPLKSHIETDNPKVLPALYTYYSHKVPGYQYSPAYKRRQWDGSKHFISKKGEFKSGLLADVIKTLAKIECKPEIVYHAGADNWEKYAGLHSTPIGDFKYYDYQESFIETALMLKRGVIKSPTGSGKTLIMAGIVQALKGRKMVLVFNAKLLVAQTYEFLTKECGIENVGINSGDGFIPGDIMLTTYQSVEKILDTHLKQAEVLMVDECHEFCNGDATLAVINSFPNAIFRIGFTATPPTDPIPSLNLQGALGPIWEDVTTRDLIEDGVLTEPKIHLIERDYTARHEDDDMSYLDVYDKYIVNNETRNKKIVEVVNGIKSQEKQARILILTKSLEHGRTLERLIGGRSVYYLQGKDELSERYKVISKFRGSKGNSVLIGTKILQTGVNIAEITHLINARGMKSDTALIQALGRALRRHDSKDQVHVYDFLDKEKYLENHSTARRRCYQREGHEVTIE